MDYEKIFFKGDKNYRNFFKKEEESIVKTRKDNLTLIEKRMEVLKKELEEERIKYSQLLEEGYNENIVLTKENYILNYSSRNGEDFYYSMQGLEVEKETEDKVIGLEHKTGKFIKIAGYIFELASILIREYKYSIATNNKSCKMELTKEFLVPLFSAESGYAKDVTNNEVMSLSNAEARRLSSAMYKNADEFLSTFFDKEKNYGVSFHELKNDLLTNKSTEIILKTIEDNLLKKQLLSIKSDKAVPVYKLVNSSKEGWQYAEKADMLYEFVKLKEMLGQKELDFNKTDFELVDYLLKVKEWKNDLSFYNIHYDDLAEELILLYKGKAPRWGRTYDFSKYYPFGKFCSYTIDAVINQGYTNMSDFINVFIDYMNMSENMEVKPTLYSNYLKQTHDIMSRNYKIQLEEEQEKTFMEAYEGFEQVEYKNYILSCPTSSRDLKNEGSSLNHCVASYIKYVIDKTSIIYFLRYKETPLESLVTVEVKNKRIIQTRGAHNRDITKEERNALENIAKKKGWTLNI